LAWLANVASNYLVSGDVPGRFGNGHPNIVPYETFATSDGWIVLNVGNDGQWRRFCEAVGRDEWLADARFATNAERVRNREALVPLIRALFVSRATAEWLKLLERVGVPAGPVNTVDRALESAQAASRGMVQLVAHPGIGPVRMVASPLSLEAPPP